MQINFDFYSAFDFKLIKSRIVFDEYDGLSIWNITQRTRNCIRNTCLYSNYRTVPSMSLHLSVTHRTLSSIYSLIAL